MPIEGEPRNQLTLAATIAEVQALRYTPAGIPALDLSLRHTSGQHEAGMERQVQLELRAIAFGTLAERLSRQSLDNSWIFQGFLTNGRNGKGVVLHIREFQPQQIF